MIDKFDYRKIVLILLKYRFFITGLVILFFLPAYLYVRYTLPTYKSETTIKIIVQTDQALSGVAGSTTPPSYSTRSDEEAFAQIDVLQSQPVLEAVVDSLNLQYSYYVRGSILTSTLYGQKPFQVVISDVNSYQYESEKIRIRLLSPSEYEIWQPLNDGAILRGRSNIPIRLWDNKSTIVVTINTFLDADNEYEFEFLSRQYAVNRVAASLKVEPARGSSVFKLTYTDENPQRAADVLNMLTRVYLASELALKQQSYDQTIFFIDTLLLELQTQVQETSDSLVIFEQQNQIPTFETRTSIQSSVLQDATLKMQELRRSLIELKELNTYISRSLDVTDISTVVLAPAVSPELGGDLVATTTELNSLITELRVKLAVFTPTSQPIQDLIARIENLKRIIAESIRSRENLVRSQIDFQNERLLGTYSALNSVPQTQRNLTSVTDNFLIRKDIYDLLIKRRLETQIARSAIVSNSRVLNQAVQASTPISPQRTITIYGSVIGGLLLGIIIALIREVLRSTISFKRELDPIAPVPVISQVIRQEKSSTKYEHARMQVMLNPKSLLAESFRQLRANILFVLTQKRRKIIAVTSTIAAEGKSFTSINLAGAFALMDKRILLIDCDLRKPRLHYSFNMSNDAGLSTYLIGKDSLEDVIQASGYTNLDVITSGPIPPNPSELLTSDLFYDSFDELLNKYDFIIVDTSPIGLVIDALPILKFVSISIYVFRANYSKRAFLDNVRMLKESHDVKDLYLLLNYADSVGGYSSYGKFGSSYMYGYGYGYGDGYTSGYYLDSQKRRKKWWEYLMIWRLL